MHTIVMCRPLHASGMALLEARHDVTIRTLNRPSAQELAAAIPGAHAVLVGLEEVDEALLAARAGPAHRVALRRRLRHGRYPRLHPAWRRGRRHQRRQRPVGGRTHADAAARGGATDDRDGRLGARRQMDAARRPSDGRACRPHHPGGRLWPHRHARGAPVRRVRHERDGVRSRLPGATHRRRRLHAGHRHRRRAAGDRRADAALSAGRGHAPHDQPRDARPDEADAPG